MNEDRIEGQWKQIRGEVRKQWGKLTDDDLDKIAGDRDKLEGRIQELYGRAKDDVRREVDTFYDRSRRPSAPRRPANGRARTGSAARPVRLESGAAGGRRGVARDRAAAWRGRRRRVRRSPCSQVPGGRRTSAAASASC